MMSTKKRCGLGLAGGMILIGLAAPVYADSRDSHMDNWRDGDASSNWAVGGANRATSVKFYDCTREFTATIRHTYTGRPDPSVGSEHINCKSYADAVQAWSDKAGNFHFDVSGMGIAYTNPQTGQLVFNSTTVNRLTINW